jgi:hypothetical protein
LGGFDGSFVESGVSSIESKVIVLKLQIKMPISIGRKVQEATLDVVLA